MERRNTDTLETDDLAPLVTAERTDTDVYNLFRLLDRTGYARVSLAGGMTVAFVQATEKGLQVARGWPVPGQSDVEVLLRLLDERIESPDTPEEERKGLRRLRDAVGSVGQSVLSSLLGAWLSQVTGAGGGQG